MVNLVKKNQETAWLNDFSYSYKIRLTVLGLGMRVMGGKVSSEGPLGTFVTEISKGGVAEIHGICVGKVYYRLI